MTARQRIQLTIQELKRLLEFLIYGLFDTVVLAGTPRTRREAEVVAIVQLKRLGDYFLWLPFGLAIVKLLEMRKERVVLVVNAAWAERARHDFPGCAVYAVEIGKLVRHWHYRMQTLMALRRMTVSQTIQSGYLRDFIVDDAIVRALGGKTLGFDAVYRDQQAINRVWTRRIYGRLLASMPSTHQHLRYRQLLRVWASPDDPNPIPVLSGSVELPMRDGLPYFVIAPGASRALKCWPPEHFIALGRRVLDREPDWIAIVAGTGSESLMGEQIARALGSRAENRAGTTSLREFIALIASARLVLGNDSAAGHIAAWYGVPAVIALGGMDFGRCYPYDPLIAPVAKPPLSVWNPMDCFGCDGTCRYPVIPGRPAPCLEAVGVAAMWEAVQEALRETDSP